MGKDEEWMRMRSIRLLKTSTHQPEGGGKNVIKYNSIFKKKSAAKYSHHPENTRWMQAMNISVQRLCVES